MVAAGLTACEPEVAFAPDQPPEALHVLTPLDVHVSVEDPAARMFTGDAESEIVGGLVRLTTTLADAVPPAPVQVRI